jgi:hypothetical protein
MYYFGCIGQPGHYLWENESKKLRYGEFPDDFPKAWLSTDKINTERMLVSAPNSYGEQGVALVQHCEGWTSVSFPDRTVDSRPNCVSVFLERGLLSLEETMNIARLEFPSVVNRYNFEIVDLWGIEA